VQALEAGAVRALLLLPHQYWRLADALPNLRPIQNRYQGLRVWPSLMWLAAA
jgi:hypothetical protein